MNIIIFILILGILVFVHELGHFLFAKLFNIRVDEFGFGYPPKMFKMFSWRGTDFTMNWIPFGGFVKIFGENDDGSELSDEEKAVSLVHKPRWQQTLVMFGGILFNLIFAWILFSGIFMAGIMAPVSSAPDNYKFENIDLTLTSIMQKSPAENAGLQVGDIVKEYYTGESTVIVQDQSIEDIARFIQENGENSDVGFVVLRDKKLENIITKPKLGIVGDSYSIGVGMDRVGKMKLPFFQSLWYGAKNTVSMTVEIFRGFGQLISGKVSIDAVSGPVGIAGQVGSAAKIGLTYLIGFAAMLSINLAVLNIIPFPALDGGRIFILLIESVIGKRLNPNIVNWINVVGFFLLIGLMLFVTVKDIIKLF
ncbi:MAG: RIP metalloprotease RseP [Candidatus Pacebacteria bacterium]|nr:RIP metalloprotease RseP [Candidatus Paceibacterota bacterium]